MRKKSIRTAAVAAALCASAAHAAGNLTDIFQLNAYGTLGVAHSNLDQADYVSTAGEQPQGAGYTRSWSPDVDSKLAVQLTAKLTERLTGVVQLISEAQQNMSWNRQPNPRYRPSLEWANLKYVLSERWSVRAGRMVLPVFLLSEYRNIGYALPFVRPPVEIYSIPFTNLDGAEIAYRSYFGSATNTVTAVAGATSLRNAATGALQSRSFMLVDKLEAGPLTLFGSYLHDRLKSPVGFGNLFQEFVQAASQVPAGTAADTASALDRRYNTNHWGSLDEADLAARYDPGNWFIMAEFSPWWSDGALGSGRCGFLTVGFRSHGLTPYASYSRISTVNAAAPIIPLGGLPPSLASYGDMLNGIAQGIASGNGSQHTISGGLRWDFVNNLDLKLQYDYVKAEAGSVGLFANEQPGFRKGSGASVFSAAIEFVF